MALTIVDFNAIASSDENQSNRISLATLQRGAKNKNNRPKLPNRQLVQCFYDGEYLTIDFAYSEGSCNVCLTDLNTGMPLYFTIDSSELNVSIYVGEIGDSSIVVTTANGNTYSGELVTN